MNAERKSQPSSTVCPKCGAPVPDTAVAGLCRKCLVLRLVGGPAPSGDRPDSATSPDSTTAAQPLGEFGDYELLAEIARGGMGIIYKARQTTVNRVVALKMIQAGRLASEAEVKRFRLEAEAAAQLDHANIVPIYEVGEHDGRLYFTMKLVEGGSLAQRLLNTEHCTLNTSEGAKKSVQYSVSSIQSAKIVAAVARAVHYAHQRGILHRDLKPANILIDEKGEPHITDFGLAKQIESASDLTLSGAVIGTPNYMAPEQAAGKNRQITTASDVYSLGAILYELLTGQPPFLADTMLGTMRAVVEQEAKRPSSINARVDRDLETICLKCLQKIPAQRYTSAETLADDLERWLRNEPIRARPSNVWEQGAKWAKRHPARAGLITLALIAPAGIIAVLLVSDAKVRRERNVALQQEQRANAAATRAETEARQATGAREQARQNLYAADMLLAQHALDDGNLSLARRLVESHRPSEKQTDLRGFEWRYLWKKCQGDSRQTLYGHSNGVYSVAFSHDGEFLASGDDIGVVKLWNVAARRPFITLPTKLARIMRVSFSADGKTLSTADNFGNVKIWDLATRKAIWDSQSRHPEAVQLSPVGSFIGVTGGSGAGGQSASDGARVVDWSTGKEVLHAGPGRDFEAFSPDGKLVFVTGSGQTEIWELATGLKVTTIAKFSHWAFPSPDGRSLAELPEGRSEIVLLDLTNHKPPTWLRFIGGTATSLAFSSDSAILATAGSDQVVRLWAVTQRELARLQGHVDAVTGVAFSPDGKLLATSSADQTVVLWPTDWSRNSEIISNAWHPHFLSPDGKKLVSPYKVEGGFTLAVWDVATHRHQELPTHGEWPEFFSADSQRFFARSTVTTGSVLQFVSWDLNAPTNPPVTTQLRLNATNRVWRTAVAPAGNVFALYQEFLNPISLWNPLTGEALGELGGVSDLGRIEPMTFSPDGQKLAGYMWRNWLVLMDRATPDKAASALLPSDVFPPAFSPDGKLLAVPCGDHTIHVWDVAAFQEVATLSGHQQAVTRVTFSPDGRTLASCAQDGTVKLWFWPARREVATLARNLTRPHFVEFTPDGNMLIVGDVVGQVHLFRAPTLAEIDRAPRW